MKLISAFFSIFMISTIITPRPSVGQSTIITNLNVYDSENASDWGIQTNLQIGDLQYGDRDYTIASLPDQYAGSDWIRTANDSKEYTGDTLATFRLADTTHVYVAMDDRVSLGSWLDGWTDTGNNLTNSEDPPKTFSIYGKSYHPNELVVIGSVAQSSSASNLIILADPGENNSNSPDPFQFSTKFDVPSLSDVNSEIITIAGLSGAVPIRISAGEFSISGGAFQSAPAEISNGDQLQIRLTTPPEYSEVALSEILVGDYKTQFAVRTLDDPSTGWGEVPDILARIQPPDFPDRDFLITDFGAVGDGETMNTDAFNQAITTCHDSGGGRVVVPDGVFLTGAIHLQSNVNLHLTKTATIKFSQDPSDYLPVVYTRFEGTECYNYSPFVYAFEQENIAITGGGTLDGQGSYQNWWAWTGQQGSDVNNLRNQAENGVPVEDRIYGEGHHLRPNMIQPYRCTNVLIDSVTILRSAMWHIHPVLCENVTVSNVTVEGDGPNNDGCNPESSRDVLIDHCLFNTGDDCIAVKSGRNADGRRVNVPSENIVVQHCTMQDGHGGVVMGSEISGSARNIFARDCYMDSPNLERALRIKTNAMRGGVVENVYFKDITIGQVADAVVRVNFYYGEGDNGDFTPTVRNIKLENVTCDESNYALRLNGYERSPVSNIQLINCDILDASRGNFLSNVANLSLNGVTINDDSLHTIIEPAGDYVIPLGLSSLSGSVPKSIHLWQNYPNPFNSSTIIRYATNRAGVVKLTIYDITGRLVHESSVKQLPAGEYSYRWDGFNQYGHPVVTGIYFYRLTLNNVPIAEKRMILMK